MKSVYMESGQILKSNTRHINIFFVKINILLIYHIIKIHNINVNITKYTRHTIFAVFTSLHMINFTHKILVKGTIYHTLLIYNPIYILIA